MMLQVEALSVFYGDAQALDERIAQLSRKARSWRSSAPTAPARPR